MARALQPESNSSEQRTLILGGVGGIGKTQLAIAYTKRHKASYTSIFWLNATSETKLKGSLRTLARRILPLAEERQFDDERIQVSVAQWLSEQNNTRWLLVFDNYDEPGLYDIKKHYPYASHGSVIITTRVPEQVNGVKIKVSPLSRVEESLRILETRSERHGVGSGTQVSIFILWTRLLTTWIRSWCPKISGEIRWLSLGPSHSWRISQAVGSQFRAISAAIRGGMGYYTATAHESA